MKRCPTCGRTYPADAAFCVADGDALVSGPAVRTDDEDVVALLGGLLAGEPAAAGPPAGTTGDAPDPVAPDPAGAGRPAGSRRRGALSVVGVALAGAVALAVFAGGRDEESYQGNTYEADMAAVVESVGDGEVFDEPTDDLGTPDVETAYVNSPGDGFLALRDAPGLQSGQRLAKISHGESLGVSDCREPTVIAGRGGRWCRATHDGSDGWVFDAFLVPTSGEVEGRVTGTVQVRRRAVVTAPEGYLNLRVGPDREAGVVAQMPSGSVVYVSECERRVWGGDIRRRWCRTEYGGTGGWASDRFLAGVSP